MQELQAYTLVARLIRYLSIHLRESPCLVSILLIYANIIKFDDFFVFVFVGGDSKALMFVQISPNENDLSETICSLNFASRVRGIELGPARKQLDTVELLRHKQMVWLMECCCIYKVLAFHCLTVIVFLFQQVYFPFLG